MHRKRAPMMPRLLLMWITLASFSCVSAAHCKDLLRIAPGFAMAIQIPGTATDKFTAIIGDPTVADVTFGPRNTFMFIGKKEGVTNIIVLKDSDGTEIYNAGIEVGSADVGLVELHNKALVTSYTLYKCTPEDCHYVREVTAAELVLLPRGYSNIQSETPLPLSTGSLPPLPAAPPAKR